MALLDSLKNAVKSVLPQQNEDGGGFCPHCGKKLPSGAKFCSGCGKAINESEYTTFEERKIVYEGEIRKCPHCGEILKSFEVVCPSCNFEIRSVKIVKSVREFALKLENCTKEEKRIEIIRNFYIPNTKEDIYEFFIYATSNLSSSEKELELDAWLVKLEQAYYKAKLSFGNTKEFENIDAIYTKVCQDQNKKLLKKATKKKWKILFCIISGFISLSMLLVGVFLGSASGDSNSPYYAMACIGMLMAIGGVPLIATSNNKNK